MKIGIGCTTFNRPEVFKLWHSQLLKHYPKTGEVKVHVEDDTPVEGRGRMGVAYRKNQCLKALKDCDYIFLFDDDCFPVADGWVEFYIDAHKASGQHHFLYLRETATLRKMDSRLFQISGCPNNPAGVAMSHAVVIGEAEVFSECGGVMMFLTKEAVKKVGAFHSDYGLYGFEHAGYSQRVHAAGLTPFGKYLHVADSDKYLYAMDYDFHRKEEFQDKVKFKSSLWGEMDKINNYIAYNRKVYERDIQQMYQPL